MTETKDKDMFIQYDNGDFISLASNIDAPVEEAEEKKTQIEQPGALGLGCMTRLPLPAGPMHVPPPCIQ